MNGSESDMSSEDMNNELPHPICVVRAFSAKPISFAEFDEFEFPSRVELGEIHEKATSIGRATLGGTRCICCNANSGKEQYHWFKDQVQAAVTPSRGVTIPLLFQLMKYYTISILLIFCLNGLVTIYEYRRMCKIYPHKCIHLLWFLPLMENHQLMDLMEPESLETLQWLDFASYIAVLICQIFVDYFIDLRQREEHRYEYAFNSSNIRTVMVSKIPEDWTSQDLKIELSQNQPDLKIQEMFFLRDTSMFHEAYKKRNAAFFNYLSLLQKQKEIKPKANKSEPVLSTSQKSVNNLEDSDSQEKDHEDIRLAQKEKEPTEEVNKAIAIALEAARNETIKMCERLHEMAEDIPTNMPCRGKAIVTLGSYEEAMLLKEEFPRSFILRLKTVMGSIFLFQREYSSSGKKLLVSNAPACEETKWENLSICVNSKSQGMILASLFSIVTAILFVLILFLVNKEITGIYIIVINVIVSIIYVIILEILADKKKGKSVTSRKQFVMTRQGFFVLIYFVCFPLIYYDYYAEQHATPTPVYSLFILFLLNTFVQFVFVFLNLERTSQTSFKGRVQKNPNVLKSIPQLELHEKLQRPEFPLEARLLGILQLWTFSALHAFICPYTLVITIILLVFHYYLYKYRLFNQFGLHTRKHIRLIRKFIQMYTIVFQFAVLYMYTISKATELQKILAYSAFAVLYLGYQIFHNTRKPIKTPSEPRGSSEVLLRQSMMTNSTSTESYSVTYQKFIARHENIKLEQKIKTILGVENPYHSDVLQSKISSVFANTEFM